LDKNIEDFEEFEREVEWDYVDAVLEDFI